MRSNSEALYSRVPTHSEDDLGFNHRARLEDGSLPHSPSHPHSSPGPSSSSAFSRCFSSLSLCSCLVLAVAAVLVLSFTSTLSTLQQHACGAGGVPYEVPVSSLPSYLSPNGTCMLVRAYRLNYHYVPTLMALLRHNTHVPNVFFHPTDSNSSLADLQLWVDRANREAGYRFGHVLNVTVEAARRDFPDLGRRQDYGFAFTDVGMDLLTSEPRYTAMCRWMLITNVDNIYSSYFLDRVEQEMARGFRLIGFNMVSHYDWVTLRNAPRDTREGSSDDGTRRLLDIKWEDGFIDLGAAFWDVSVWRQYNFNFIQLGLNGPHKLLQVADGQFFEQLVKYNTPRIAIRQIMFMHQ